MSGLSHGRAGSRLAAAAAPRGAGAGVAPADLDRASQLAALSAAAAAALAAYGLEAASLTPLDHKKNTTFRVDDPAAQAGAAAGAGADAGFVPGRYLLRLCDPFDYDAREILSELQWLLALRRSAGLVVPEPVAARDGALVHPGRFAWLPGRPRHAVLFRWVRGEVLQSALCPERVEAVGELLARLHDAAERFVPPPGFTRPRWDCERLFGTGGVVPEGAAEPLITRRGRQLLDAAARRVRETVAAVGEGPRTFGLIHKDLEPDNVVVCGGEPRAIDFADCGWGHYLYDVAASLLPLRDRQGFAELRAAFLRGYRRRRPLPPRDEALVETFSIARCLFAIRLMATQTMVIPRVGEYARTAIPHMLGEIRRFVESGGDGAWAPGGAAGAGAEGGTAGDEAGSAGADLARLTTVQLLSRLRAADVRLWAEGERLRFAAPPGALTHAWRQELAERKHEILAFLRQGRTASGPGPVRAAAGDGAPVPLSFAQQRLWFIDQLRPGSTEYNIARAVLLEGDVRPGVLRRSLDEVVRRHAALRTTFRMVGDQPAQVVAPALTLPLPLVDLASLPAAARRPEAERLAARHAHRPFDLTRGPLLRIALLRLGERQTIAASSMHHIVGDGWSTGLLFREMGVLYEACAAGRPSPLPELPIQYADFARWQRRHLDGEVLAEHLAYWRRQLEGGPDLLDLPTDRPRTALRSARGARRALTLPRQLVEPLKALGQQEGAATLFMTLFAVFNALLGRCSGQRDLVVGFPIANRNRTEVEPLIGCFVNTLVLRIRLDGQPSFRELLRRVRQVTLGAYAHQDLPFEKLVEELRPERRLDQTPFFQIAFSLQNVPHPDMRLPSFRMSLLPPISLMAQFDLSCDMKEMPEGVRTSWRYRTELFDGATIARLVEHYQRLLAAAAAEPDRRIEDLPLLGAAELHQLCREWNPAAGAAAGRPVRLLHELFAAQALARPDAVALAAAGECVTYGELARRASRLAGHLRLAGVGPATPVGLSLERSPRAVTAMLAILEAGGAYVPLDPSYPPERLRLLIDGAGIETVVTESAWAARLDAATLCLDVLERRWSGREEEAPAPPPAVLSADSPAYVIYTSGSTGAPKGVAVPHRAVVRLVRGADYIGMGADEVFLQLAPLSFDAATLEIWGPLLNGGRLAIAPPGPPPVEELTAMLAVHGVTTLFLTTGLFNEVAERGLEGLGGLRQLLTGGEVASLPHLGRVLSSCPGLQLVHVYGPTENTTFTTWFPLSRAPAEGAGGWRASGSAPIGRPIAGTRVCILDPQARPVPIGVAGELHAGGDGLASCYAGQPGLTAEKLVPDAQGAAPGDRLYRTGDLARWLPDGNIAFLGRLDQQVKVRGFRIEPAEVEAALCRHPRVEAAVVALREDLPGGKGLAAYLAGRPGAGRPEAAALRAFLGERLPPFMLPDAYVWLDRLPLNANGKVDRRALPPPAVRRERDLAARRPPRLPAEQLVAACFAELLDVEPIGLDDDFFALGGHSLLATRLATRLRQCFAVELPLRQVFETPTPGALAGAIGQALRAGAALPAPPLQPVARPPRGGPLPLSFAQQRLWFLDQLEPGSPLYNLPLALRIEGDLDAGALGAAFAAMVRRHEALRTVFAATAAGEPVQVIQPPADRFPLVIVDLSRLPAERREPVARQLAAAEARRPFDLAAGPLLRVALLRLGPAPGARRTGAAVAAAGGPAPGSPRHVVLASLHHAIGDGWSLGVMVREMAALYQASRAGRPSPLPELPVQYADFAVWQRRWLRGAALAAQLDYWRRQLAGAARRLALPTDRPRPPVPDRRGAVRALTLDSELARQLRQLSRAGGCTLFMTLLAALQLLLARYAAQRDVAVGTPIANRTRHETEDLIGFFVNTLVLCTRIEPELGWDELLARVREVTLGAYTHQDLPFEKLVEELQPERSRAISPLFQAMLLLREAPAASPAIPGLALSVMGSPDIGAKFDLTLSLTELPDGIAGALEYSRELFDPATAERLAAGFVRLLRAAAADAGAGGEAGTRREAAGRSASRRPVFDLDLLGEAQRQQLLAEWGAGLPAERTGGRLHHLFEAQARRTPEAVAVVCQEQSLTWGELDRLAGGLAGRLRGLGVGPDVAVGICAQRSPALIVGLLGILKAGGAYLPLDPDYPPERLAFMASDARVAALLVDARGETLPELAPGARRHPLTAWLRTEVGGGVAGAAAVGPRQDGAGGSDGVPAAAAAYLLYTSGSTGRPKGVVVSHAAICNHMHWLQRAFPVGGADRVLQRTPLGFDAAVWEVFLPLLTGARLVLAPPGAHGDPAALLDVIHEQQVTVLQMVPSLLAAFLEAPGARQACGTLRRLFCGGEPLPRDLVERFAACLGRPLGVSLHNLYGPTEAAIDVSSWSCGEEPGPGVPVGRPIENLRLLVLDDTGRLAPAGAAGELHVGGAGLARGYLRQPALTAERFVPNPFGGPPGSRLYRTGDLARWRADGGLELLGRGDRQVKLRGFRIELGEIEAALLEHPAVRQAVVEPRQDVPGEPRLVAYFVALAGQTAPAPAALAEHLRRRLPEPMLPAAFVALEALPLSPSGKLDRRLLPRPQAAAPGRAQAAPRDLVELQLAAIWEDLLHAGPVGPSDGFFALGGHSLLAARLMSRIQARFGARLPVAALFESPTLEALAARLRQDAPAPRRAALVHLHGQGDGPPLFLVHPAGGDVLCYWHLAAALRAGAPVYGLQLPEPGDLAAATGCGRPGIEDLARHYLRELRAAWPPGPYCLAGWSLGGVIAFEMARQLELQGLEVALLALIDSVAPPAAPAPPAAGSRLLRRFAADVAGLLGLPAGAAEAAWTDPAGDGREALQALADRGREQGLLPHDFDQPEIERRFALFETSMTALAGYRPGPYGGPLLLFAAEESRGAGHDAAHGWAALAAGGVDRRPLPGSHYSMVQPPAVQTIAAELRARLAALGERPRAGGQGSASLAAPPADGRWSRDAMGG